MTAPLPSPRLSPTAGLFNALLRLAIRRLGERVTELRSLIDAEKELTHELTTARDYADSERSGYVDRSFLEGL